jgi:hypothetical protein
MPGSVASGTLFIYAELSQTSFFPTAKVGSPYTVTLCTNVSGYIYIQILNLKINSYVFSSEYKMFLYLYSLRTGNLQYSFFTAPMKNNLSSFGSLIQLKSNAYC